MKFFKDFKKARKLLKDRYWLAKSKYPGYVRKLPLEEKRILLESEHGKKLDGNIFYILKYLSSAPEYADYEIYLSSIGRNMKRFREFLQAHGIDRVKTVMLATDEYMRILASAKYLINDTSFGPYFVKREGQIYINTWHGTPLKTLGKADIEDFYAIGNIQKNFLATDYLLYPNEYTEEIMLRDYMLKNISRGKTFLAGYPRNEIFFDKDASDKVRLELGVEGKKVYAYMPTYRGSVSKGKTDFNTVYLTYYLSKIDKALREDEVFYVNLHPLAKDAIDFKCFKNIKTFPKSYEVYEFLNAADVLITDYSSVFFDFAPSGKKIVLFTYDEDEYLLSRGMYMDIRELPFPRVSDEKELIAEMRADKNYDEREFLEKFCPYECIDASKKLCDRFILGKENGIEPRPIPDNGRKNVVIYTGNLASNGITASLRSLLSHADTGKYNYFLTFNSDDIKPNRGVIREFPDEVGYIATGGDMNLTVAERIYRKLYKYKLFSSNLYMEKMKTAMAHELKRKYADAKIDTLIQFNGYEFEVILNFASFNGNNAIFVHNDMVKEATVKGNQRMDVLEYAYRNYSSVAIVTEDMRAPTLSISEKPENIKVVRNTINCKKVLQGAELEVEYDSYTEASVDLEHLNEILESDSKKFINIGRFSYEKGQDRLIRQFAKYCRENDPRSYLIIIGGYAAPKYLEVIKKIARDNDVAERVIFIKKMSNPYAVLKRCDYFILSSRYEGFGLVLAEADMLGLPVVSTDIEGPRLFMQQHGGVLVEDSESGIYGGLVMLGDGKVDVMGVDYDAYNREAVAEFESLID